MKIKSLVFKHIDYLGIITSNDLIKDLPTSKINVLERYKKKDLMKRIQSTADSYKNYWVKAYLNGKKVYQKESEAF